MKLVKTDLHRLTAQTKTVCNSCAITIRLHASYADIEGKPFSAYYCSDCKKQLEREI